MAEDIIRVVRILEYVGERSSIEAGLQHTAVPLNGEHQFGRNVIRSAMLGSFAEILERAQAPISPSKGLLEYAAAVEAAATTAAAVRVILAPNTEAELYDLPYTTAPWSEPIGRGRTKPCCYCGQEILVRIAAYVIPNRASNPLPHQYQFAHASCYREDLEARGRLRGVSGGYGLSGSPPASPPPTAAPAPPPPADDDLPF